MKGLSTVLIFLLLVSCTESGVQLAKPSTFVRYYNGGFDDVAQAIIETSDKGFLILANTNSNTKLGSFFYKIKLIKTDAYGNQLWQKLFPDFLPAANDIISLQGFGLAAIQDITGADTGYVIVGDQIKSTTNHNLLMIQVDKNGSSPTVKIWDKLNVQGTAIAWSKSSGDFFLLGQTQSTTKSMFFAEVDKTTMDTLWSKSFGDGTSTLANRLFLDYTETTAYWGGTVSYNGIGSQIRYVNSGFNTQIVGFNLPIGNSSSYNLTGSDLSQHGFGYAFIGSHSPIGSSGQYDSIYYTSLTSNGNRLLRATFPLVVASQTAQAGNSICSTQDGGLLLLGTVALDAQGTDTDYYLIKLDAKGKTQWKKQLGGKSVDQGVRVLQASDGGYMVLGTTTLANVKSILLLKTDLQGNIQ